MARKSKTPPVQPVLPSNEPSPAVTFSPAALQALIDEVTASRAEMAELKAGLIASNKAKMATPAPVAAKPAVDRSAQNVALTVRAFKKIGVTGEILPHQNILTFRKWIERGYRPVEGSKAVKVSNLRLWHISQCRLLTQAELKAIAKQQADAVARHDKANGKGKPGNVTPLNPQ